MSARYLWATDASLLIVGFPVGGEDVDKMAMEYLDLSQKTHSSYSVEAIVDLTESEYGEIARHASEVVSREGGKVVGLIDYPPTLVIEYRRKDLTAYQVVREYRAFRLSLREARRAA